MKNTFRFLIISACLLLGLIFTSNHIFSQIPPVRDTVYLTSSEIKKLVDEKYYVRVPSYDLEQRLQDKVSVVVNDKFNFIYGLIGIISFVIGGGLLFSLRSSLKNAVETELEKRIAKIDSKLTESLSDIKDYNKENFSDFDRRLEVTIENYFLKNSKRSIDEAIKELREQQQKAIQEQEDFSKKSIEILKVFNEAKFEKLSANVESRLELQKTFDSLKDLLSQADKMNDVEMISKVLNQLSYVCFYLKKDAEFERIIDEYTNRTDVNIRESAYVNVALGTLMDYKTTGEDAYRKKTLGYLNKALQKLPDYGEALGLKLEVFMTDYDSSVDDSKKKIALKEAKKLLNDNSASNIASYEIISRFRRVQASAAKSKYIELLYQLLPDDVKAMEDIADEYGKTLGAA